MFTSWRNRQKSQTKLDHGGKNLPPAVRRRPPTRKLSLALGTPHFSVRGKAPPRGLTE